MNAMTAIEKTAGKLQLVKKPVRKAAPLEGLREGSTGRVVVISPQNLLPKVWAVAEPEVAPENAAPNAVPSKAKPAVELAFYRKYTEALLRRYLRLSMQSGRVPSLLSKDLFRGHVTRYSVRGFEEVVIFCHDVEQRLARLNPTEQEIIKRIVLQSYTQGEVACVLGMGLTVLRERYAVAIDRVTAMLLEAGLLDPQKL